LEEKRAKGLCYSCDSKYTKGHKCAEKKLFYIDCEEEEEKEQEMSKSIQNRFEKSRPRHLSYHDFSLLYIINPRVGFPLISYPCTPACDPGLPLFIPYFIHLSVTYHQLLKDVA